MINPDILAYITNARKNGIADELIRQSLLDANWRSEDVALAFLPTIPALHVIPKNASTPDDSSKKKLRSELIKEGLAVVLLLLISPIGFLKFFVPTVVLSLIGIFVYTAIGIWCRQNPARYLRISGMSIVGLVGLFIVTTIGGGMESQSLGIFAAIFFGVAQAISALLGGVGAVVTLKLHKWISEHFGTSVSKGVLVSFLSMMIVGIIFYSIANG